jgi:hypothetical protein
LYLALGLVEGLSSGLASTLAQNLALTLVHNVALSLVLIVFKLKFMKIKNKKWLKTDKNKNK